MISNHPGGKTNHRFLSGLMKSGIALPLCHSEVKLRRIVRCIRFWEQHFVPRESSVKPLNRKAVRQRNWLFKLFKPFRRCQWIQSVIHRSPWRETEGNLNNSVVHPPPGIYHNINRRCIDCVPEKFRNRPVSRTVNSNQITLKTAFHCKGIRGKNWCTVLFRLLVKEPARLITADLYLNRAGIVSRLRINTQWWCPESRTKTVESSFDLFPKYLHHKSSLYVPSSVIATGLKYCFISSGRFEISKV